MRLVGDSGVLATIILCSLQQSEVVCVEDVVDVPSFFLEIVAGIITLTLCSVVLGILEFSFFDSGSPLWMNPLAQPGISETLVCVFLQSNLAVSVLISCSYEWQ